MLFNEFDNPNISETELDVQTKVNGVFCPLIKAQCTVECIFFEPTVDANEVEIKECADGPYYKWDVPEFQGVCLLRERLMAKSGLRSPLVEEWRKKPQG